MGSCRNNSKEDITGENEEEVNSKVTPTVSGLHTLPTNLSDERNVASNESLTESIENATTSVTKSKYRCHFPNTRLLENLTFGERDSTATCSNASILVEYCNDELDAEQETEQVMWQFMLDNEKLIKQFGMIRNRVDSKYFLQTHTHLLSEHVANYMVVWSINLILQKSFDLLNNVAHQLMCLQYIMEVSNSLIETDPLFCISSFFSHMTYWDSSERREFASDIDRFKQRLTKFTEGDIWGAFADAAIDESERRELADPNCFEPVNVYKELPIVLRKRIELQDSHLIRRTFDALPEEISKYFFKCCVDCELLNSECIVNMDVVERTLNMIEEEKIREVTQDNNKAKHTDTDSDAENANDDRTCPMTPKSFEYNTSDTDEPTRLKECYDADPDSREFIIDIIMPQEHMDTDIYKFVEQKFQETIVGIKRRSGNRNLTFNPTTIISELDTKDITDDDYDSDFLTNNNIIVTDISEEETDEDLISGTESHKYVEESVDGDELESLTAFTNNENLISLLNIAPPPSLLPRNCGEGSCELQQLENTVFNGVVIPNSIGSLPSKFVDKTQKNHANCEIVKSNLLTSQQNLVERNAIFNLDDFDESQTENATNKPLDNGNDTNENLFSRSVVDVADDANVEDPEAAANQEFLNKILSAIGNGAKITYPTAQQWQTNVGGRNLVCKVPKNTTNQQSFSFAHSAARNEAMEYLDNSMTLKDELFKDAEEDDEAEYLDISDDETVPENNNTLKDAEEKDIQSSKQN